MQRFFDTATAPAGPNLKAPVCINITLKKKKTYSLDSLVLRNQAPRRILSFISTTFFFMVDYTHMSSALKVS